MPRVPGRQLKAAHTADLPQPWHSLSSLDVGGRCYGDPSGYYQKAFCAVALPV